MQRTYKPVILDQSELRYIVKLLEVAGEVRFRTEDDKKKHHQLLQKLQSWLRKPN